MKGEHYPLESTPDKEFFFFQSIGPKGVFVKAVWFQKRPLGKQVFNLALCIIKDSVFLDDVETNNEDFVKTMFTVVRAILNFLETYPEAKIQIGAGEEQRLRIYNNIVQRKLDEVKTKLIVKGFINKRRELIQRGKFYEMFEVSLRKR